MPSQKGLLSEEPQRQRVTRLRCSYRIPSGPLIGMPPCTHRGPLHFSWESSISPNAGRKGGSMKASFCLSHNFNLPEGQRVLSWMAACRAFGSLERKVSFQTDFFAMQIRACTQYFKLSSNRTMGPSYDSAFSSRGVLSAVRVESHSAWAWEPSQ